jgi:hypothetical protein
MVDYITKDMRVAAAGAKWPHGPLVHIVLGAYTLIALIWFESHGGSDLSFLPDE